jgi:hypothetical protein
MGREGESLVVGGGVLTLALSPLLIAGWGPVPSLGHDQGLGADTILIYCRNRVMRNFFVGDVDHEPARSTIPCDEESMGGR